MKLIRPEETFLLTVSTLEKLYSNELSSLTAFLQEPNEKGVMCSLIDIKNKKEENRFWDGDKLEQESWISSVGRIFLQAGFLTGFIRQK